jgi:alpha-mannosidase
VGGWRDGGVLREAVLFNAPLRWTQPVGESFARCDDANLVVDTVTRGERSGTLLLRLYEAHGARGSAQVTLREPFTRARIVDALEEPQGDARVDGDTVFLDYAPHQVLTVLVD